MGASCWMRPLFVYTDNNFLKRGRSPLIFRFLFLYLPRISEKGVPCANAMAEIIPNEPDTDHAGVGIFLSVLFYYYSFHPKYLYGCSCSVFFLIFNHRKK